MGEVSSWFVAFRHERSINCGGSAGNIAMVAGDGGSGGLSLSLFIFISLFPPGPVFSFQYSVFSGIDCSVAGEN